MGEDTVMIGYRDGHSTVISEAGVVLSINGVPVEKKTEVALIIKNKEKGGTIDDDAN